MSNEDEEFQKKLNFAVFPGSQGGPLMHVIAAKAVCFKEAMTSDFRDYQKQIISNAKTMCKQFKSRGFNLVQKDTDNHLILMDLRNKKVTGKEVEELTQKEIIMALRGKNDRSRESKTTSEDEFEVKNPDSLKSAYESVKGKAEAVILDSDSNEIERVSVTELSKKLTDFENAAIVVMDGKTNASIIRAGYKQKLELIVASKKPSRTTAVNVMTVDDF